jgi:hypothetical protein
MVLLSCRNWGVYFFSTGLAMLRNTPASAASAVRMLSPAARHSEFIPPELAAIEGAQD